MSLSAFFCDYVYRYVFEQDQKQLLKLLNADRSNLRRDVRRIKAGKDSPHMMELLMDACLDRDVDVDMILRVYQSTRDQSAPPCCSHSYVQTRIDLLLAEHAEFASMNQEDSSLYNHFRKIQRHIKTVDCGENARHIAKCPMFTTAPVSEPVDELLIDCPCKRLELLITSLGVWRLERIDT